MNTDIRGVHFNLKDEYKELIEKKMHKLNFVKEHIVDFNLAVSQDAKDVVFDAQIHFKWGVVAHVTERDAEFQKGIDKLFDSLSTKAHKEKDKIQDHKAVHPEESL